VEALVAIRIAAMRESLERIGRFDRQRARERFLAGFDPALRASAANRFYERHGFELERRSEWDDHYVRHPR